MKMLMLTKSEEKEEMDDGSEEVLPFALSNLLLY